jgi:hypothetical protein
MKQEALQLVVNPDDVTDRLILQKCRNLRHALKLCRDCSPLSDEEIIVELEKRGKKMQRSHFIESLNSGPRNYPPDAIQDLEDICHNLIPTRFLALSRNCELRPKREAWEIENDRLREEIEARDRLIEQERQKTEAIADFIKRTRGQVVRI